MLGKRGLTGLALLAAALLGAETASAQNYTEIQECDETHVHNSCGPGAVLKIPVAEGTALPYVNSAVFDACATPVVVPVGTNEVALCAERHGGSWLAGDVSIARLRLEGRETELAMDYGSGGLVTSTAFSLRSEGKGVRVVSECRQGPDVEGTYCAPYDLIRLP